jgi:hypothetical protein
MKIPNIFQEIDKYSKAELFNYGSYLIVPNNTPYKLYISYTFRLNNYRICNIIYNKSVCVLAKQIGKDDIYIGYISSLQLLSNESLGGLKGLNHIIPNINLIYKSRYDYILYHLLNYLNKIFKITIHKIVLENYLSINNFINNNYYSDDDNGLNEYEYIYDKWVKEDIKEHLEYIDL